MARLKAELGRLGPLKLKARAAAAAAAGSSPGAGGAPGLTAAEEAQLGREAGWRGELASIEADVAAANAHLAGAAGEAIVELDRIVALHPRASPSSPDSRTRSVFAVSSL